MTQRETAIPPGPSPTTGEATDLEQLLAYLVTGLTAWLLIFGLF
jgi:hypothetical protein